MRFESTETKIERPWRRGAAGSWLFAILAVFVLAGGSCGSSEHWPAFTPDPTWKPLIAEVRAAYVAKGYSYKPSLQTYSPIGDYLNTGLTDHYRDIPGFMRLDASGVPMVNYHGQFYYNPVTVGQFTLSEHGKFIEGLEPNLTKFWAGVNKLLELQSSDGSFPYTFDFEYYHNTKFFKAPWTSAMAQGTALSVFARAWHLSGDSRYLVAGNKAFAYLSKEVSEGGVTDDLHDLDPSLSGVLFADEYPTKPSAYTLNGFMFTMLGVYDWAKSSPPSKTQAMATLYFNQCRRTLDKVLPYYDVGGWSAYDMGHIIYKDPPDLTASYHVAHIYLLHALFSVTADPVLQKYELLWRSYVPD